MYSFITLDVDECLKSICMNGGQCTNLYGGYKCDCLIGYNGKSCEYGQLYLNVYEYMWIRNKSIQNYII